MIGINGGGAVQILARLLQVSHPQLRLRGAQLIANLLRLFVSGASVSFSRALLVAIQFVGVAKIGKHCRSHVRRAHQSRDGRLVVVLLAIVISGCLKDLDVTWSMFLGLIQHLLGAVGLLQLQVRHGQHQLGMCAGLLGLSALQEADAFLGVARLHVKFAGNQQIVGAIRIGVNDLQQQTLGVVGAAHALVSLCQTAHAVGISRSGLQTMLVSLD